MSRKPAYTDEVLHIGEDVIGLLPPPSQLVKRNSTAKITLEVTERSLRFFKAHAKKSRVPYQRMLRGLLDAYVSQCEAESRRV